MASGSRFSVFQEIARSPSREESGLKTTTTTTLKTTKSSLEIASNKKEATSTNQKNTKTSTTVRTKVDVRKAIPKPISAAAKNVKPKVTNTSQKLIKTKVANRAVGETSQEFLQRYRESENRDYENDLKQAIELSEQEFEKRTQKRDRIKKVDDGLGNGIVIEVVKNKSPSTSGKSKPKGTSQNVVSNNAKKLTKTDAKKKNVLITTEDCGPNVDVRLLQLQDKLEKKDEEIAKLHEENSKLKEDASELQKRNAKYYALLQKVGSKVDTILLVEELNKIKDELTQEVVRLNVELEQERSKVSKIRLELFRLQNSRKDSK